MSKNNMKVIKVGFQNFQRNRHIQPKRREGNYYGSSSRVAPDERTPPTTHRNSIAGQRLYWRK